MRGTVDPSAVLGGRPVAGRDFVEVAALPARGRPASGEGGAPAGGGPKRPKLDLDAVLTAEVDASLEAGCLPEIGGWRVTDANQLALTINLGTVTFSGLLPANLPMRALTSPATQRWAAPPPPQQPAAAAASARAASAAAAAQRRADEDGEWVSDEGEQEEGAAPPPPPPGSLALAREPPLEVAAQQDEKHAGAAAEYERLLIAGPAPGEKCSMCHRAGVDAVPPHGRGPGGRSEVGLGSLMLVRASAVSNAWVHDQCARWSPEVYDPLGDGLLEGVKEAVRRGRMIKCKVCNLKGATLGCLKRTCRTSYHLPCAREYGCLLQVEPYVVACPGHTNDLPDGAGKRSRSVARQPGPRRSGGSRPSAKDAAAERMAALGAAAAHLDAQATTSPPSGGDDEDYAPGR